MKGYIHSFESLGTKDGPGIRYVVFMQGCPLRCKFCHNVDTWNMKAYQHEREPQDILNELLKIRSFIRSGGITISGGEALVQAKFVTEVFKLCRENNIHTTLDTSGFIFNDAAKETLEYTDLVLLDIKHIDPDKYKELTKVSLEPTLKFAEYLKEKNIKTWLRYVLIPGITDDEKDLINWAKYCGKLTNVERVDILPFHQLAIHKWEQVGIVYPLKDTRVPTIEEIKKAEDIFSDFGLPVKLTNRSQ